MPHAVIRNSEAVVESHGEALGFGAIQEATVPNCRGAFVSQIVYLAKRASMASRDATDKLISVSLLATDRARGRKRHQF